MKIMHLEFRDIFRKMDLHKLGTDGYYVIVLTDPSQLHTKTINGILMDFWKVYVTNVVILIPTQNYNKILLYTYFPYSEEHFEQVKPILRNYFENNSYKHGLSHFPQKCKNFHQCPLHVSTCTYSPYMMYGEVNGTFIVYGIENILFEELSKSLHFDYVLLRTKNWSESKMHVIIF